MMEKEIIVGKEGKYPLKGLLSLPDNTSSPVPAVILVHGSGSTDMDESVWANKPFRDIAANLLRADSNIDLSRVYILGHSLGGMLAPRIDCDR